MVLNNINGRFDQKLLRHFQYIVMNDVPPAVNITTVLYRSLIFNAEEQFYYFEVLSTTI